MPNKDVIVVGASAGGVEVLKVFAAGLPADLDAAVLIVLHMAPSSPSVLPPLLQRRCALPVAFGTDGEPLVHGRVYIAPPDRHLVVEAGRLRVTRAPHENHSRPAIDPLFRSAALAYGPRVIGVVLSGRLDDGTAGLWAVKDRGGLAVVQDPGDAVHPDMPRNALVHTAADYLVHAEELAPLVTRLTREPVVVPTSRPSPELELEVGIAMGRNALQAGVMGLGPVSPYTCPACHGVLVRVEESPIVRFRCHKGHAYSLDSLLASTTESVDETLWNALHALEESAMLLREVAARAATSPGGNGSHGVDPRVEQQAREADARADMIRQAVHRHQALSLEKIRSGVEDAPGHPAAARSNGRGPVHG